jgi:hypothetical protein
MNLSRRELLAAGAVSAASALPARPNTTEQGTQSKPAVPPAAQTLPASNPPIRDYLARDARRITDNALVDLKTPDESNRRLPQRRRRFMEIMGLSDLSAANASPCPPARQDVASQNGKGPSQIAGLLHPAQIVVSGEFPSTYEWAEELYGRLGSVDKFRRVKAMSDWA